MFTPVDLKSPFINTRSRLGGRPYIGYSGDKSAAEHNGEVHSDAGSEADLYGVVDDDGISDIDGGEGGVGSQGGEGEAEPELDFSGDGGVTTKPPTADSPGSTLPPISQQSKVRRTADRTIR